MLESDHPQREIWSLQYGPCFCYSTPGSSGSFDFVRFRTSKIDGRLILSNTLVVSDRVIEGSLSTFHRVYERLEAPKIVIAAATCPRATRFWEELPAGWTPVTEVFPVDGHIRECIGGRPEALAAHVLETQSLSLRQPEAV